MAFKPTGTCFTDALECLAELIRENPERLYNGEFVLVHGICEADDGHFSHAWLERDHACEAWTSGLVQGETVMVVVDRPEFYHRFRVVDTTKYSARDALRENRRHANFGPWERKYLVLCGNYRAGMSHSVNRP